MIKIINACLNGLIYSTGVVCVVDYPNPSVVKYYEPGKSCYVNGTFYTKCEDRLNGTK
jgi:hypothetical protein